MNPAQFARKHLEHHQIRGGEIKPMYCPYCHGGSNHDKYTFALNESKLTFNCKRGSCDKSGTFWQLCRDFGEKADSEKAFELAQQKEREFKAPQTKTTPATAKVEAYLEKRGFSKGTWERCGVKESAGNIAFPYLEDGKLVLMKFRKPEKYAGGGQKAWREEGGKAVFWLMDDCDPAYPLVICEGEFDALACQEAGVRNVVSVPSGAEDLTCLDNCWDWLEQFNRITIWPDGDEPGQKMARNLIARLGSWRCSVVECDAKDANELLYRAGKEAVQAVVECAREIPISGLVRLSDVEALDLDNIERVPSSIYRLNETTGGYMMGAVSVWTGGSAAGKSTFLGQELLWAISKGHAVCAFSGELPAPIFRYWCELQAAGPMHLQWKYDSLKNNNTFFPSVETKEKLRAWYQDKFFLVDSFGSADDKTMLEMFEYAARRYGCKVFLVDNLMTTIFSGSESDFYRQQGSFVGRLVEFAHRLNVHVHVVAHPRKTNMKPTKMDVAGTAEITNRADNVFCVRRLNDDDKEERNTDAATVLEVFKSRFSGQQDVEIELNFDDSSRRFCVPSDKDGFNRKYGWEEKGGN